MRSLQKNPTLIFFLLMSTILWLSAAGAAEYTDNQTRPELNISVEESDTRTAGVASSEIKTAYKSPVQSDNVSIPGHSDTAFNCEYDPPEIDPYHPPLYWSVYEHHYVKEQQNVHNNFISEGELWTNILWVEEHLLPLGYDMIAMDGWGDLNNLNDNGYRLSHSSQWNNDFAWWACHLRSLGMHLGMYDNPLWVHMNAVNAGATVVGTEIPLSDIIDRNEETLWFTWVQVDREGAEEYVKGNIQHWADMGIRFLNVDFLSWFEDGYDKNMGDVGPDRPREHYETAMRWMFEAAEENGMLLKAVMPHLNDEAKLEMQYSHMFRINEDTAWGGWDRFSEDDRGNRRPWWSQWANPMDGYAYWSQLTGRGDVTLCGDFIRLNTFENDDEKRSVISQHLVAGGPLGVSDQHNTIDGDLWLYQNEEMLALNYDGFVGKPLSHDPVDPQSQIWTGQMTDGDWVVALFNRNSTPRTRSINFSDDLDGFPTDRNGSVRDLWAHEDLGVLSSFSARIPANGVRVLRIEPIVDSASESIDDSYAGGIPSEVNLSQNYPNPFNPSTRIRYSLPMAAHVTVEVFDVSGRHVATLVDRPMPAGEHVVDFDSADLTSGIYVYRISSSGHTLTRRMTLIK